MKKYTFEDIREKGLLLYEFVRGSVSQGINTPLSDIDHGGVYLAPAEQLLGLGIDYQDEIKSEKGDDDWGRTSTPSCGRDWVLRPAPEAW